MCLYLCLEEDKSAGPTIESEQGTQPCALTFAPFPLITAKRHCVWLENPQHFKHWIYTSYILYIYMNMWIVLHTVHNISYQHLYIDII